MHFTMPNIGIKHDNENLDKTFNTNDNKCSVVSSFLHLLCLIAIKSPRFNQRELSQIKHLPIIGAHKIFSLIWQKVLQIVNDERKINEDMAV